MKFLKCIAVAIALALSGGANAAMILVYHDIGNDSDAAAVDALVGVTGLDELARMDWNASEPLANPQSDGGLTINGTTFKVPDDPTEATAGTWSWSGPGTLEYLSFKYDGYVAIYEITDGMTSGSWDTAALCASVNCGNKNALSHSAAYGVVPVPAAAWLFASGLLGLAAVSRRKS